MKIAITIFTLFAFTLIACEQHLKFKVTVFDKITQKPLDSVLLEMKVGENNYFKDYTNSSGTIETKIMIGCAFGCYDIYTQYSKNGYIIKKEVNKTEGIVELEKTKNPITE